MGRTVLLGRARASILRGGAEEPRRLAWWGALPAAAVGGLLLDAASPSLAWWPAAFLGVLLVLMAVWQQRPGLGAAAGAVFGAGFWMPHIFWLTLYLGPVPWMGLCGVMILWCALFGAATALATRGIAGLPRLLAGRGGAGGDPGARGPGRAPRIRLRWVAAAQAVAAAALWTTREQVQASWPYGGFDWGRVAYTQAESPLAQAVSWTGTGGLTALIVLACAIPVATLFALARRRPARPASGPPFRTRLLQACGAALVLLLVAGLAPAAPLVGGEPASGGASDGTASGEPRSIRVAAVQGNAKAGIFDDRESGDVLRDHVDATEALLQELEASGDSVDVIVWPENSAEFDLPGQVLHAQLVAGLAQQADAPIVVGSVLRDIRDGEETYTNSSIVWGPRGDEGVRYDKRRPVPFAEYMPNRSFFHALAPDLVDLVQLEYTPGTRPAALPIEGAGGGFRAGIAICFDITFDEHLRAMQDAGAEVIFAQTNNADFGRTDESAQQLQIARLRAVEMGRSLVNISTVGTSAIVAPDGSDVDRLTPHTADAMVADVPLRTGSTPAMILGRWVSGAWMLLGPASLGLGLVSTTLLARSRRGASRASRSPLPTASPRPRRGGS